MYLENDHCQQNLEKKSLVENTVSLNFFMSMCNNNLKPTVDVNLILTVDVTKMFVFDLLLMVSWHQLFILF